MHSILIRPLEVKDAEQSWKWRNDPEIWKFTGSRPNQIITYETEKAWIERVLPDQTAVRFAILADGNYIGNIQLTNIEKNKRAEYHIFIGDKAYWGKGVALLASYQLIRFAKTVLKLEEVYLHVNPANVGAIKVYQKCNFKKVNDEIRMELNLLQEIVPKVSIFLMVYNHEPYLKETLDSMLVQKCDFDFEIVIGEDCSKDNSRKRLIDYSEKYPGKFKLLLHPLNIGAHNNQKAILDNCTGKYIAMCEGDDYWTDPDKLQKQIDFLDAHSEFTFCTHRYRIYSEFSKQFEKEISPLKFQPYDQRYKGIVVNKDVFHSNWVTQPLTAVLRNDIWQKVEKDYYKFQYFRDYHLFYLFLDYGNGLCMDFVGGVYRKHEGGVHAGTNDVARYKMALLIYEELYLFSKDRRFFIAYWTAIFILIKKRKHIKLILKSFFLHLGLKDKLKATASLLPFFHTILSQKLRLKKA